MKHFALAEDRPKPISLVEGEHYCRIGITTAVVG